MIWLTGNRENKWLFTLNEFIRMINIQHTKLETHGG
jgi:hypothetical protein